MVERARQFAIDAHGDQQYGEKPYIYHLERVVAHLRAFGDEAVAAGYLHDVIEDTVVDIDTVRDEFGETVARSVNLVTDEDGANRKERKTKTYAKMAAVKPGSPEELGLIVKAADRLANFEECILNNDVSLLRMYEKEHEQFRAAVYRKNLCDDIWSKIEAIVNRDQN